MLNDKDGSGIERFSNDRDQMNGDPAMHERLIRMPEVTRTVGLSRATIYRMIDRGEFPQPVRQGRTSAWPLNEIHDYLEALKAARLANT